MDALVSFVVVLVIAFAIASLLTLPLMLFLGNLGLNIGFWGAFPGAIVLGTIGGSASTKKS